MPDPNSSPAKVLVVDDSPGVLHIASAVLGEAGLEVVCVREAAEVQTTALELQPDLIVLDDGMPPNGGYALCAQLGERDELAGIPVIIMNTRGEPAGDRFIRELGVVDHINKPFAPEALVAVVQHTLQKPNFRRRPFLPGDDLATRMAPAPAAARLAYEIADALALTDQHAVERVQRLLESSGAGALVRDLFFERSDGPNLVGDLGVVPIAEVLQALSLQRQSGFLRVVHGAQAITIALKDGAVRLVTGENVPEELLLGSILVQERMIPAAELELLLSNRKGTRQRLGNQVVKLGYLERDQLHAALRRQSAELVYELLRWSTGRFTFTREEQLPQAVLEFEFGLTTDELLMEGFRRVDEWGLIEKVMPSLDLVPRHVPGGEAHTGPRGLTAEEQAILALVNERRTARQIIEAAGGAPFDGARMLYRLLAARVLTIYKGDIGLDGEPSENGTTP